jgi:hypothetical protein
MLPGARHRHIYLRRMLPGSVGMVQWSVGLAAGNSLFVAALSAQDSVTFADDHFGKQQP